MNKAQKDYLKAKAAHEAIEKLIAKIEADYIKANGIKNADGTIPAKSWMIDDESAFEKMMVDLENELNACEIGIAYEALKKTEDALIRYGLSLIQKVKDVEKVQNVLLGKKAIYAYRQKWIELTMKVPAYCF